MAYFKINDHDYSAYCNELAVKSNVTYRAQTNAAGNTVVDNANTKRTIEVGIIPLFDDVMQQLLNDVAQFEVNISYRNPQTNTLEEEILCIIPSSEVEYYTIQANKVMYKALTLTFTEL